MEKIYFKEEGRAREIQNNQKCITRLYYETDIGWGLILFSKATLFQMIHPDLNFLFDNRNVDLIIYNDYCQILTKLKSLKDSLVLSANERNNLNKAFNLINKTRDNMENR